MVSVAKRLRKAPRLSRQDVYFAGMILYVIILGAKHAGDYTLFQGFSVNALDEFAALHAISRLPAHVDELFRKQDETARERMHGQTGYSIILLESELFGQLECHPGFVCVISNAATRASVAAHFATRRDKRWLHVTTAEEASDEPKLWVLDRPRIYKWVKDAVIEIGSMRRGRKPTDSGFRPLASWDKLSAPLPSRGHNVLTPTETVFLSLGYAGY